MDLSTAKRSLLVVISVTLLALVGTSGDKPDPPPADASVVDLAAVFATCRGAEVHSFAPAYLSGAVGWLRVERVVAADRDSGDRQPNFPARVLARESVTSEIREVEVDMHSSYWPGIDWALASGAEVWLGLGDDELFNTTGNPVLYPIIFTIDGRAFFPGNCQHKLLYKPLQVWFGDSFEETMRSMIGKTGDELTALVNPAR